MTEPKSRKKTNKDDKEVNMALPSFVETKKEKKNGKMVSDRHNAYDDKNIIVEKTIKKKKINIKFIAIFMCFLLIFATLVFALRFVKFNVTEMLWKISLTKGSDNINNKSIRYKSFSNGMIRISNDGITYVNAMGKVKWTISYNMKEPVYESTDKYFAIADKNGFEFYIFDENGLVGKNTSTYPIQKISLSENGILYILENDENSSYINIYRANGAVVDISVKTNFTGDGMPIDISVSADGTELVTADTCLQDNEIFSKAIYYNFDEVGKNANAKRIVGEFKVEFDEKFLVRVHFFDNEKSCLIHDGGIYFVSTSMLVKPRIINTITYSERIKSISYNKNYLVVILASDKMIVYDKDGSVQAEKELNHEYDNFYIDDDYIIFLCSERVVIYDKRARMIFDKMIDKEIQYVAKKKSLVFTELFLGLVDGIECIRFY